MNTLKHGLSNAPVEAISNKINSYSGKGMVLGI
ncbi:MAG: hypothetical protein II929_01330 [Succinivibrio sp.]|nr:hypothetical protein [Succinivibrio sp.]